MRGEITLRRSESTEIVVDITHSEIKSVSRLFRDRFVGTAISTNWYRWRDIMGDSHNMVRRYILENCNDNRLAEQENYAFYAWITLR